MNREISCSSINGRVKVPSSKSLAHRYLIQGFLSSEEVEIKDISFSDDVLATLNALIAMGGHVQKNSDSVIFLKPNLTQKDVVIDAKESGSTLRFLLPLASAMYPHVKFVGAKSLFARPLSVYENILKKQNIRYEKGEDYFEIFSSMCSEDQVIPGDISSQFITGLLYLNFYNKANNSIKITLPYQSKEYVDITVDIAKSFGYVVDEWLHTYHLKKYIKPSNKVFYVEKDFSQMAFFALLGTLKGNLDILDANFDSLQGDKAMFDILKEMGGHIVKKNNVVSLYQSTLKPTTIDLASCIDLGPILFVTCALTKGKSHIKNIARLRIKESDRVSVMVEELSKVGVTFEESENDIYITGKNHYEGNYCFNSHNDHRIAMALTIFALINRGTCVIENSECVNKSYPDFFVDIAKIGGVVNVK